MAQAHHPAPHADAHAPTHEEHTGHGAHHVLSQQTLLRTFGALVVLTVVTVVAALMERAHWLPLGSLSVPFALAIAGAKATLVAMFFMGLKYDRPSNVLSFVSALVFLGIFLAFTFLDTEFRETYDAASAVPVDVLTAEEAALQARQQEISVNPQTLLGTPDTLLFANPQTDPTSGPAPAPAEAAGAGNAGTGASGGGGN